MHIGIDGRPLQNKIRGIGIYTKNLVELLPKIAPKHHYTLFVDKPISKKIEGVNIQLIPRWCGRNFWEIFTLPKYIKKVKVDLYHGTDHFCIPMHHCCKLIITIHDLTTLLFPKTVSYKFYLLFKYRLLRAVKIADKIIATSESTKNDIIKLLNVPAEKIVVTYEGVSSLFQPVIVDFNKLSKFSISTKFILSVSALEPRKNIKTLIKAFLNLKEQGKLNEYQLVIVGEPWRKAAEIYKMAKGYKDIVFTGYVSEDDLVLLYNAAEIFVYPSFYEGFGLPPLEALACGTPVIAVNSSSISEVVGDSALLINEPENVQEFSNAILTLIESLHLKQKLKEKGLAQVKKFSWEKMVQQTISVYESITK